MALLFKQMFPHLNLRCHPVLQSFLFMFYTNIGGTETQPWRFHCDPDYGAVELGCRNLNFKYQAPTQNT